MKRILLAMAVVVVAACGQGATSEEAGSESVAYEAAAEAPAAPAQEAAIVCPGDERCDNVETMPAAQ